MTASQSTPRPAGLETQTPTLRDWIALGVLVLPVLLISIDMTVLGFAVPALSEDLAPSGTQLLWIVDLYSFLLAGLLVLMGNLGDRIGRRRLLLIGAVAFGAASMLAAFSTSAEMLIAARALLGIGGATLMPSTLSLIRTVFPNPTYRRTAIAVWAAAFAGGAAIGPVLGGLLLEHFWWGVVFLINVPIMALLLVGGKIFLPESKNPNPGPFDVVSAAMSIVGVLALVYGLKTFGKGDIGLDAWLGVIAGIAIITIFIRRQLRLDEPLLEVRLFAQRSFTVAVLTNLFSIFALLGVMFFLPQYLQLVLGMSELRAGLWMLPLAISTIIGALTAPQLANHVSMGTIIGSGMLIATSGLVAGVFLDEAGPLVIVFASGVLVGAGIGLAETLTNDTIIASAPPEKAGGAAAISETAYEFGAAMGTAILGTIGLAVYRGDVLANVSPDVPEEAVSAATQTLGAAKEVVADLPEPIAGPFMETLNQAFAHGFTVALIVAAAVCLYAGVQALVLLRDRKPIEGAKPAGADSGEEQAVSH